MHTCDRRRTVTKISISLLIGSLAAYAVFHTPARQIVAGLLSVNAGRCYFCGPWPTPERLVAAGSAVLFIICAIVASIRGARRFPGMNYELPIVSAVLFTFFIAVPASVVGGVASWSGYPLLRAPVGPIVCGVIVMAFIVGDLSRKRPRKVRTWTGFRLATGRSFLPAVLMSLAALLLLLSAAIAFLHPPRAYDALAYHAPLGILIWRDGDLTTYLRENPEYWSLAHPATAEILYGLLQVAGGEALANLGQLPFALLGAASVYAVARRLRCSARSACVAAASFLLAPIVISQIGTQLNDLAGAALVLAAVALIVGQRDRSVGRPLVVGIALGLAVTTKLLLIPVVVVVLAAAALVSATSVRNRMSRLTYGQLLVTLLVVCAIATPWWLRNLLLYRNPVYPAALPFVSRGVSPSDFVPKDREFVPTTALWPIYPVLEPHNDQSGFGPIVGIAGIIGLTL